MFHHLSLRLLGSLAICFAVSCGSSSNALFEQAAGGAASKDGGPDGSSVGGSGGESGEGGGGGIGEGGSAGAIETGGSDAGQGGGEPADAGEEDSAPIEGTGTVACGSSACDVSSGGHCCLGQPGPMPSTPVCRANSSQDCQMGQITVSCDGAEDCQSDQVCCAALTQLGPITNLTAVACKAAGTCTGEKAAVVCNPAASDPCPLGGTCQTDSSMPTGYAICK